MPEFRAYVINSNNRIESRVDLVYDSEKEAEEKAKQLVDGHDVELWQGARKLARFYHRE